MRLLFALLAMAGAARGIVMPPSSAGDQDLAIVIVQGAFVHPEQYRALGEALQAASASSLWVGIAEGFLDNCPNPLQVGAAVRDVLEALDDAGMPNGTDVFVAGHSLGGVFIPAYVKAHADSVRGMLLFGSYLTGEPLAGFPVPVLHLSGTLDGQTRPTRIAQTFAELQQLAEQDADAPLRRPVVLVEAVDHAHFFTGDLPPSVAANDVRSEMAGDDARRLLAAQSVAFMEVARAGPAASAGAAALRQAFNSTGQFLAPLYGLQQQEADGNGSAWGEWALRRLLNVADDSATLDVRSVHEPDLSTLEHQHPTAEATGAASAAVVVFSSVERPFNPADISVDPVTSSEIAVKMVSQELVASLLPNASFGAVRSCRDLNQATLDAALAAAPATASERFGRRGHPAQLLDDHMALAGPLWVFERLRLTYGDGGLQVQSVAIKSAVDSPFFPGSHYCKLLTPSRALEYVLIDGLRGTEP